MLLSPFIYPVETILHIILKKYLAESYCFTIISEEPFEFTFSNSFIYINPNNCNDLVSILIDVTNKGCSDFIIRMREPQYFMYALDSAHYLGDVRRSDKTII